MLRWGRKIQVYIFNEFSRTITIWAACENRNSIRRKKKSAVIIPEDEYDWGYTELVEKILRYLGKA